MERYEELLDFYRSWLNAPIHVRLVEAGVNSLIGRKEDARTAIQKFQDSELPKPDPLRMANMHIRMCARATEGELLRKIYREAGLGI
jgi:hypothetical protein